MAKACPPGLAVVAIDFGTTYSGYAFSYKYDPSKVYCNSKWTTGNSLHASMKTPTAILLKWNKNKRDFEKVDFGYDAQRRYAEMEEAERRDHVIADHFKMKLYSESAGAGLRRDFEVELANGRKIKVMRLISMFIEYLKDHFLELQTKRDTQIKLSDIRWVLTVPAIWTDAAKQFMRCAAEMAGIPSSDLMIVYEPEAAALHCLHLRDPKSSRAKPVLTEGAKYLVIDAGGGTVDFTVLEVTGPQSMKSIHSPSGGPWGGVVVDEKFREFIYSIIGREAFDRFARDHRDDNFELSYNFECKKRQKLDKDEKIVNIRIPATLSSLIASAFSKNASGRCLDAPAYARYTDKIKIGQGRLRMDRELMDDLFKDPCERIVEHTKHLLGKTGPLDAILLVGGFGSSDVVQKSVTANFPQYRVAIPEQPELAIVTGAVHYGNNPQAVQSRIAVYTYGTDYCKKFQRGNHPEVKRETHGSVQQCEDLFDVHVHKGQCVTLGQFESTARYRPVSPDHSAMEFDIYASTKKDPTFIDDEGCSKIGELTIDLPGRGLDRIVKAEMSFGETELLVKATEEKTGKRVSAWFNCLDIGESRDSTPRASDSRKVIDSDEYWW